MVDEVDVADCGAAGNAHIRGGRTGTDIAGGLQYQGFIAGQSASAGQWQRNGGGADRNAGEAVGAIGRRGRGRRGCHTADDVADGDRDAGQVGIDVAGSAKHFGGRAQLIPHLAADAAGGHHGR